MQLPSIQTLAGLTLLAPNALALLRFSCSQLVVERLDPLINPGMVGSPHLHQVIGGNAFQPDMTPDSLPDIPSTASCTTCTFAEDFSNYWTAVLYFRARNGTFKRVPQKPNVGFEAASGGLTVYYTPSYTGGSVTAFKPGFRMIVGNPENRDESKVPRQLTYTCLQNSMTRTGETAGMPKKACPAGIMANIRFPTCWNGKDLDPPDHTSHVAYPSSGSFESGGPCPSTHPVKIPQVFYEVIWDTTQFNNPADWPEDGSQPFVWSNGDATGYGNHGDYVFGWKGDALQTAMDTNCNINCPQLKSQTIQQGNQCSVKPVVSEEIDGWLTELPGGMEVH
ncbi:hypothetical protein F4780DRAFT_768894 [Xylariomycetidae sp. FL0641]|nr:hypothetical protein F4780DRAFT_768894 [Xylariomycetidae sp. FL0641]